MQSKGSGKFQKLLECKNSGKSQSSTPQLFFVFMYFNIAGKKGSGVRIPNELPGTMTLKYSAVPTFYRKSLLVYCVCSSSTKATGMAGSPLGTRNFCEPARPEEAKRILFCKSHSDNSAIFLLRIACSYYLY